MVRRFQHGYIDYTSAWDDTVASLVSHDTIATHRTTTQSVFAEI